MKQKFIFTCSSLYEEIIAYPQLFTLFSFIFTIYRSRYRQHNMYVEAACPKENLLIFNVEEGWEPLCKFLGVDIPNQPFPRKNVKTEIVDQVAKGTFEHDCGYHKIVVRETATRVVALITLILAAISYFFYMW